MHCPYCGNKESEEPVYKGIIAVTEDPVVSSDIIGNSHSAIVDLSLTQVVGGTMLKVIAWYDNEYGYANRLVEQVVMVGEKQQKAEGASVAGQPSQSPSAPSSPSSSTQNPGLSDPFAQQAAPLPNTQQQQQDASYANVLNQLADLKQSTPEPAPAPLSSPIGDTDKTP